MKWIILPTLLFCCNCTHIQQVNLESAVSNEIRPESNREGAFVGIKTVLTNKIKIGVKYRSRLTDFNTKQTEHGFFINLSVPIWKK